jgi:hypothetical protein
MGLIVTELLRSTFPSHLTAFLAQSRLLDPVNECPLSGE